MQALAEWSSYLKFELFGDQQLVDMVTETAHFIHAMKAKEKPRWLSFTGTSGAGKTYLARAIWRWYSKAPGMNQTKTVNHEVVYGGQFAFWPDVAQALKAQEATTWMRDLADETLVVIDDIGAARDSTGFVTNELSNLLSRRCSKWTVITANFPLKEIAQKMDVRIASRMIRDNSVVVDVDVKDFNLRSR